MTDSNSVNAVQWRSGMGGLEAVAAGLAAISR